MAGDLPYIERATSFGQSIALRVGARDYTYADLVARSCDVAVALLNCQADLQEARVALLLAPGFDYVATQWGVWRAGGVTVPLSLAASDSELTYALSDAAVSVVITSSDLADRVSGLVSPLGVRLMVVEQVSGGAAKALPAITSERRAMILYTSGTTSKPKGVVTTHANIQAQIESLIDAWQWSRSDCIPLFLPLHHIHGIVNVQACALWSGATVEVFPHFELQSVVSRVAEKAYTLFMAVPTIYVKLIQSLEAGLIENRQQAIEGFAQMRLMVSGSAALPASVHEKWFVLTGQKLLERYGMTEIGMALSNPYLGERRPGAVGIPLPGVEVRLVAEQDDVIEDELLAGEIQVKGPGVFREYWNRPAATAESFAGKWFRTGDVAVREQGYYRILGRQSVDIIKSGGYKLSALEIEAALLEHQAIRECAVIGIPDDLWGEAVAATVTLRAGEKLSLETLRMWCKDRLSTYKIPKRLLVVSDLPRNAMGKVTKSAVRELFE